MADFGAVADSATIRRVCRAAFLARIEQLAPSVLRSLQEDVFPVFEKALGETRTEKEVPAASDLGEETVREDAPAWTRWSWEPRGTKVSKWETEIEDQLKSVQDLRSEMESWARSHNLAWRRGGELVNAWLLDVALRTLVTWERWPRKIERCRAAVEAARTDEVRETRSRELAEAQKLKQEVLGRFRKPSGSSAFRARFMDPTELEQAMAAARHAEEREARAEDLRERGREAEALMEEAAAADALPSIFDLQDEELGLPGELPAFAFRPPFLVTETKEEWRKALQSRLTDYLNLIERLTQRHLQHRTGNSPVPRARTRAGDPFLHFEWLVRFQVLKETYKSIAADPLRAGRQETMEPGAVGYAVRGKAKLIGLILRSMRGRPRRQEDRGPWKDKATPAPTVPPCRCGAQPEYRERKVKGSKASYHQCPECGLTGTLAAGYDQEAWAEAYWVREIEAPAWSWDLEDVPEVDFAPHLGLKAGQSIYWHFVEGSWRVEDHSLSDEQARAIFEWGRMEFGELEYPECGAPGPECLCQACRGPWRGPTSARSNRGRLSKRKPEDG